MFGQGLVKSLNDFGTQGTLPSHPDLLDWLAVEFVESGWDVKHLLKLMAAVRTPTGKRRRPRKRCNKRDPHNVWLARQNRFRLDAEMVHDNALGNQAVFLLRKSVGRASSHTSRAGYWSYLNFPKREWMNDKGDGLYRRGLYTYLVSRTFLHPSLAAFDAPTREECTVDRAAAPARRCRSLVLLNDPIYVEEYRARVRGACRQGGRHHHRRPRPLGLPRAPSRAIPRPRKASCSAPWYEKHLAEYSKDKDAAQKLVSTGDYPVPKDVDVAELAAWTSVARVVLNLHETITRQ